MPGTLKVNSSNTKIHLRNFFDLILRIYWFHPFCVLIQDGSLGGFTKVILLTERTVCLLKVH